MLIPLMGTRAFRLTPILSSCYSLGRPIAVERSEPLAALYAPRLGYIGLHIHESVYTAKRP